jgi:hypothetical protein
MPLATRQKQALPQLSECQVGAGDRLGGDVERVSISADSMTSAQARRSTACRRRRSASGTMAASWSPW